MIGDSPTHYWSGNNNQIYTSLVALHNDGFVTREVEHQDDAPSRKIYTITDAGRAELKAWAMSQPEMPDWKVPFLVQLAWTHDLDGDELDALLASYAERLRVEVLMLSELAQRGAPSPDRTQRESFLWQQIEDHWITLYTNELNWIESLRTGLRSQTYTQGNET